MKSPRIDLLALDLDGTLLDSEGQLPERNRAALHRAHLAGVKIVLCTGRAYLETRPVIEQIGLDLDAAVTVFGAVITNVRTHRTIERVLMDPVVAHELTAWLVGHDYPVLWLSDPLDGELHGYSVNGQRLHAAHARWLTRSPCRVQRVDQVPRDATPPVRVSIVDDPYQLRPLAEELPRRFGARLAHNVLQACNWDFAVMEAFAPGVSKWHGVQRLCEQWGISPSRTAAIGDDVNDLQMITHAGLGFAVANARPEVRAAAGRVLGTNDECAVEQMIDDFVL